jgi:hypothetical protein
MPPSPVAKYIADQKPPQRKALQALPIGHQESGA